MATGTGSGDLLEAIRAVQLSNSTLSEVGVFLGNAPETDPLPYILNSVYQPSKGIKKLNGRDSQRRFLIQMKAVAGEAGGYTGFEIAQNLAGLNYELWTEIIDGLTPKQRLNAALNPLGWAADMPLERMDVGPYNDTANRTERHHVGHIFLFVISRI